MFSCLQQAEEHNFFTSFSQNLGFVDLPNSVYHQKGLQEQMTLHEQELLKASKSSCFLTCRVT